MLKLLKYEFRATGRVFLPFFGALIVISVINRILGAIFDGSGAPYVIGMVIAVMLMVAVFVVAYVLMIQRFSKNLIGDEGYLMFTLPVSVDAIIFSKMIVSAVWFILNALIVVISIMIMALVDIGRVWPFIRDFLNGIFSFGMGAVGITIQAIIFLILTMFSSVLMFYMCIALSMLFNRRRGLASVGIYMALMTAMQTLGALGIGFLGTDLVGVMFGWIGNLSEAGIANMMLLGSNLVGIVVSGIMYFVTRFMLSRKLNLE